MIKDSTGSNRRKQIAVKLMQTIPPCMRMIRTQMRLAARDELTVPQLRALLSVRRGLSQITMMAEDQGVSQPAMSKMIKLLMKKGWIVKEPPLPHQDQRGLRVKLTSDGNQFLDQIKGRTQIQIGKYLESISELQLHDLAAALTRLESILLLPKGRGHRK